MNEIMIYNNYSEFKQALDKEMLGVAEGFVKIGYLLRMAQETNVLAESGYSNVNEFAKAEYNIDATQVSRFIRIHERFGVPGEMRLQDRYASHGVAKLGIMLTLPDEINEEISSTYSKTEINQIKAEIEAEQKISDLEVMMEEKDPVQQSLPEGLKKAVYQLIHDFPGDYERMYKALTIDELKDALAPSGEATYTIRIPGTGKLMIFAKAGENIVITNVRSMAKESYEWQQLFDAMKEYAAMGSSAKESWENTFNETYPLAEKPKEEPKPAVKEQQKAAPKPAKKESKVKVPEKPKSVPKSAESVPKSAESVPKPVETVPKPEEQLPGQDNIMNHPEYLPEEMKEEVLTGEVEDVVEETQEADKHNVQQSEEIAPVQENKTVRGYKAAISTSIKRLEVLFEKKDWKSLEIEAEKIAWRAKQIMMQTREEK